MFSIIPYLAFLKLDFATLSPSTVHTRELQSRYAEMQAKVRDLEAELEEETRQRIFFEEASYDLEEDQVYVQGEREELISLVEAVKQEVVDLKAEKGELIASLETAKQEVAHITSEKEYLAIFLSATVKRVVDANANCDLLRSSTAALVADRDNLSCDLIITCTEADALIQELASANHELSASFTTMRDQFNALEVERGGLAVALVVAEMDISAAMTRCADLQASVATLSVERNDVHATLSANQEVADIAFNALSASRDELASSLRTAEAKVLEMIADREVLRATFEDEFKSHAAEQAQHERTAAALTAETKKTRELQHAQVAARRQIAHLSERCSRLSSAIIMLQREKAALEDANAALQGTARAKDGNLVLTAALLRAAEDNAAGLRRRLEDAEGSVFAGAAAVKEQEARHALEVDTLNGAVRVAQAQADDERAARCEPVKQLAEARTQLDLERRSAADARACVQAEAARYAQLQQRLHLAHDRLGDQHRAALALERDLHNAQLLATHYHARAADDGPVSQEAKIARFKRAAAQVATLVAARAEEETMSRERAEGESVVLKTRLAEADARNEQLDSVVRRCNEKLALVRAQLKQEQETRRGLEAYHKRVIETPPGLVSEKQDELMGLSKRQVDQNAGYPFVTPTRMEDSTSFFAKGTSTPHSSPVLGIVRSVNAAVESVAIPYRRLSNPFTWFLSPQKPPADVNASYDSQLLS